MTPLWGLLLAMLAGINAERTGPFSDPDLQPLEMVAHSLAMDHAVLMAATGDLQFEARAAAVAALQEELGASAAHELIGVTYLSEGADLCDAIPAFMQTHMTMGGPDQKAIFDAQYTHALVGVALYEDDRSVWESVILLASPTRLREDRFIELDDECSDDGVADDEATTSAPRCSFGALKHEVRASQGTAFRSDIR